MNNNKKILKNPKYRNFSLLRVNDIINSFSTSEGQFCKFYQNFNNVLSLYGFISRNLLHKNSFDMGEELVYKHRFYKISEKFLFGISFLCVFTYVICIL